MSLSLFRGPFRVMSAARRAPQKRERSRSPPMCELDPANARLSPSAMPMQKSQRSLRGCVTRPRHSSPDTVVCTLSRRRNRTSSVSSLCSMASDDSRGTDRRGESAHESHPGSDCLSDFGDLDMSQVDIDIMRACLGDGTDACGADVPQRPRVPGRASEGTLLFGAFRVADYDSSDSDDEDGGFEAPEGRPLRREAAFVMPRAQRSLRACPAPPVARRAATGGQQQTGARVAAAQACPSALPAGRLRSASSTTTLACKVALLREREASCSSVASAPASTAAQDRVCRAAARRVLAPRLPPNLPRGAVLYGHGHPLKRSLYGCGSTVKEEEGEVGSGGGAGGGAGGGSDEPQTLFGFMHAENERMRVYQDMCGGDRSMLAGPSLARTATFAPRPCQAARPEAPQEGAPAPMWKFG